MRLANSKAFDQHSVVRARLVLGAFSAGPTLQTCPWAPLKVLDFPTYRQFQPMFSSVHVNSQPIKLV